MAWIAGACGLLLLLALYVIYRAFRKHRMVHDEVLLTLEQKLSSVLIDLCLSYCERNIVFERSFSCRYAYDIAVSKDGTIYVLAKKAFHDNLCVYNSKGRLLREWDARFGEKDVFQPIRGMALSSQNEVFLSDGLKHQINVFTSQGRFLRGWGVDGAGPIAVASNGLVYVECGTLECYVYTTQGNHVGTISHPGRSYSGMTLSPNSKRLYLVDSGKLHMFCTLTEEYIGEMKIPEFGYDDSALRIAFDLRDRLYILNRSTKRIGYLNEKGDLQTWDNGAHDLPWGMAILNNKVYVVDIRRSLVESFRLDLA